MEQTYLKPRILFIGYNNFKNEVYARFFSEKLEFHITYQDYSHNIWSIFKKQYVDIIIVRAQYFENVFKVLLYKLRYSYPHMGLVLLLDQNDEKQRILALETGADSCLNSAISAEELHAEIHALYRRLQPSSECQQHVYHFQGYTVDIYSREIRTPKGKLLQGLTSGDFLLLKTFLENSNRVLSRDFLLSKVSHYNDAASSRSIDIRVSRLRKKLGLAKLIKAVYGEGYIFKGLT